MMRGGLTPDQCDYVVDVARSLPANQRSRFFESIVDQTLPKENVDHRAIVEAINYTLCRTRVLEVFKNAAERQ
jgi:hypothetical protein